MGQCTEFSSAVMGEEGNKKTSQGSGKGNISWGEQLGAIAVSSVVKHELWSLMQWCGAPGRVGG